MLHVRNKPGNWLVQPGIHAILRDVHLLDLRWFSTLTDNHDSRIAWETPQRPCCLRHLPLFGLGHLQVSVANVSSSMGFQMGFNMLTILRHIPVITHTCLLPIASTPLLVIFLLLSNFLWNKSQIFYVHSVFWQFRI